MCFTTRDQSDAAFPIKRNGRERPKQGYSSAFSLPAFLLARPLRGRPEQLTLEVALQFTKRVP